MNAWLCRFQQDSSSSISSLLALLPLPHLNQILRIILVYWYSWSSSDCNFGSSFLPLFGLFSSDLSLLMPRAHDPASGIQTKVLKEGSEDISRNKCNASQKPLPVKCVACATCRNCEIKAFSETASETLEPKAVICRHAQRLKDAWDTTPAEPSADGDSQCESFQRSGALITWILNSRALVIRTPNL